MKRQHAEEHLESTNSENNAKLPLKLNAVVLITKMKDANVSAEIVTLASSKKLKHIDNPLEIILAVNLHPKSFALKNHADLHTDNVSNKNSVFANLFASDIPEKNATTKSMDLATRKSIQLASANGKETFAKSQPKLNVERIKIAYL